VSFIILRLLVCALLQRGAHGGDGLSDDVAVDCGLGGVVLPAWSYHRRCRTYHHIVRSQLKTQQIHTTQS